MDAWLLALIPLILFLFLFLGRKTGTRITYSIIALVAHLRASWILRLTRALLFLVLAAMVAALARPVTGGGLIPVMTNVRDTILLIDRSGSMDYAYAESAEDEVSRIVTELATKSSELSEKPTTKYDLARYLAAKFIDERPNDRITACVFFDYAFSSYFEYQIICPLPLTRYEHDIITQWLRMPDKADGGTPLGQAMIAALRHLDEMGQTGERTLILLSDGDGTWSGEMEVVISELLAKTHAKLFWVYIEPRSIIDYNIENRAWSASQLGLMRLISQTGGRRFDAGSPGALAEALETIQRLQTKSAVVWVPAPERDLYPFVVSGALILFLLTFAWIRIRIR